MVFVRKKDENVLSKYKTGNSLREALVRTCVFSKLSRNFGQNCAKSSQICLKMSKNLAAQPVQKRCVRNTCVPQDSGSTTRSVCAMKKRSCAHDLHELSVGRDP